MGRYQSDYIGSYPVQLSAQQQKTVYILRSGHITVGSPENVCIPDRCVPKSLSKNAPQTIKTRIESATQTSDGTWFGTLLFVPSGGSVTGTGTYLGPINCAGGVVHFGIDATPSAAAAHPVLTLQGTRSGASVPNGDKVWFTANGNTPSLSDTAIAGIQCSAIQSVTPANAYRLLVTAGANTGVSSPVTIRYRVVY